MTQRYNGGFKGVNIYSSRDGDTSGVFDIKAQHTFSVADAWSGAGLVQIDTDNYNATGLGPITSITDLEEEYASQLPREFFLQYNILHSAGAEGYSTVNARVKNENGKFSQSSFTLQANLSVTGITTILPYANDDHDSLLMNGFGNGVLARSNSDRFDGMAGWDLFKGTSVLASNTSLENAFPGATAQGMFTGIQTLVIPFPGLNGEMVYFNLANQRYSLSGSAYATIPPAIYSAIYPGNTTTQIRNTHMVLSDGINSFLMYRYGATEAAYVEMDMQTRLIYKYEIVPFYTISPANRTEEDVAGDQLFAVNGSFSWCQSRYFYYSRGAGAGTNTVPGWRQASGFTTSGMTSTLVGAGVDTQTGYDIMSSIDTNDRVWFADWGHDNGGLFGFGNDDRLGTAQTNIYKLNPDELGVL